MHRRAYGRSTIGLFDRWEGRGYDHVCSLCRGPEFVVTPLGHSRSLEVAPFESCGTVFYSRNIGEKSRFFHTPLHLVPPLGGPSQDIAVPKN